MKVLAIGNSFSQDATRYLHQIAKADGTDLKIVNLYIGGCSLRTHYINTIEDKKSYFLEFNGVNTGFMISVKEALISDEWDVVTIQQVSSKSPYYETYQPFLDFIADYIRKYSPQSKIYIHQTWAYEQGSKRLCEELGYGDYTQMLKDVENAYNKAAKAIKADGIIPSGQVFHNLLISGITKIHRDTFHASLGLGRYALALVWYEKLTGRSVANNSFNEFDEPISADEIGAAKNAARKAVSEK